MKTYVHFWPYLASFFLEREMFHTTARENKNKLFILKELFFLNRAILWDKMEGKKCAAGQATMTIWRMRVACWILKATNTQHV